ncbi:MAG: hypothetical protein ABUS48_00805 [Pseudomonadota bacterium]
MADQQIAVPIFPVIARAVRNAAQNWRAAAVAGVLGAVLSTLFSLLTFSVAPLGLIWSVLAIVVTSYVYTALTGAALNGEAGLSQRVAQEGLRVLGAMFIVGFFLFIIFVVTAIVDAFIIAAAAADYVPQMQAASGDQAALMQVMARFFHDKPGPVIVVALINIAIWYALTSRLYVAAPASYDASRILSFETWRWTKGNLLRIVAARLLLLLPLYCLVAGVGVGLNILMGVTNVFDADAVEQTVRAAPAKFAVLSLVGDFLQFALYMALEAALSAEIYKVLKPQGRLAEAFT